MQFSKNTSNGSGKSLLIKIVFVLIIFIGAMPKKSRALGPPQAMKKRTYQRAAGEEKIAAALCEKDLCTTGL